MNLQELKEQVFATHEAATEDGHDPKEVEVSIQIEVGADSVCSRTDVELRYDDYGCVSGCVLTGEGDENTELHSPLSFTDGELYAVRENMLNFLESIVVGGCNDDEGRRSLAIRPVSDFDAGGDLDSECEVLAAQGVVRKIDQIMDY